MLRLYLCVFAGMSSADDIHCVHVEEISCTNHLKVSRYILVEISLSLMFQVLALLHQAMLCICKVVSFLICGEFLHVTNIFIGHKAPVNPYMSL